MPFEIQTNKELNKMERAQIIHQIDVARGLLYHTSPFYIVQSILQEKKRREELEENNMWRADREWVMKMVRKVFIK